MSLDPGFSSARNLIDLGGQDEFQNIVFKAKSIIKNTKKIILYKFSGVDNDVEKIDIIIKFKNYKNILDDRSIAITKGFLENPLEVPGRLTYMGKTYQAKIRLKGDLGDHWLSKYRMSLRINLKGDETIMGMNTFSIQKPRARQHPYEQAFQGSIRRLGNLAANHQYAQVSFNGQGWGVMNLEEHLSKEFLEKQAKKESLIFRFSDDLKWRTYNKSTQAPYNYYRLSSPKIIGSVYGEKKYFKDRINRARYTYIMEERLKDNHSHIYSRKEHIVAFFNSLFWNNFHTLSVHNTKYYFNPYTLKLSPITGDQGMFNALDKDLKTNLNQIPLLINHKQIFSSFRDSENNEQYFEESLSSLKNIEHSLNQYKNYFPLDIDKNDHILKSNIDELKEQQEILFDWMQSYKRPVLESTPDDMPSDAQAREFPAHLHVRHYDDGALHIYNFLPDVVQIDDILYDGKETIHKNIIVPGYKENEYIPLIIRTNFTGIQDGKIAVISSYKGIQNNTNIFPTMYSKGVFNPIIDQIYLPPSFLTEVEEHQWEIPKGDWTVNEPLIVEGNLTIRAGAHIRFKEKAYLLIKGTLNIKGEKNNPVLLEASESLWKGLYLLSKEKQISNIENVVIKNTQDLQDGILALTSGVNIYSGEINLNNVSILQSTAEDAINIVNASVLINDLLIEDAYSDGLDCDSCLGKITNSNFFGIGGDAIDFSSSVVELDNINISRVKDKAISIGEGSNINIIDSNLSYIGVGIATKDGSRGRADNVTMENFDLHAAMTYSKKKHFDSFASLSLNDCSVIGDNPYASQIGTSMTINGNKIEETNIDVDALYSDGPMKK